MSAYEDDIIDRLKITALQQPQQNQDGQELASNDNWQQNFHGDTNG